ncbi:MAG: ferritin family protein [Methanomassiliicoccales archaeon]
MNKAVESIEDEISILVAAIRIEEYGYEFYLELSRQIDDHIGAALFRGLARDEELHKSMLEREILEMKPEVKISELTPATSFVGLIPEKVFPQNLRSDSDKKEEYIQSIQIGIIVEERSVKMYGEAAATVLNPKTKNLLLGLAKWEEEHKKLLDENLHTLKTEGAWYGYVPILEG